MIQLIETAYDQFVTCSVCKIGQQTDFDGWRGAVSAEDSLSWLNMEDDDWAFLCASAADKQSVLYKLD